MTVKRRIFQPREGEPIVEILATYDTISGEFYAGTRVDEFGPFSPPLEVLRVEDETDEAGSRMRAAGVQIDPVEVDLVASVIGMWMPGDPVRLREAARGVIDGLAMFRSVRASPATTGPDPVTVVDDGIRNARPDDPTWLGTGGIVRDPGLSAVGDAGPEGIEPPPGDSAES